jgi:glycosyltransferase involved in cell wall biosynthesis
MPEAGGGTKVLYISYDGLEEPLGRSQVMPYLVRLASDYDITLISFEKAASPPRALVSHVSEAGIEWIPLRYHRRPPVLSTALDVAAGRRALRRAARRQGPPAIVHVRSDVPALIALSSAKKTEAKLLFDIRGFWADERVEGGIWRLGGVLYRLAKRCELRFYGRADLIVTLTRASLPHIRSWVGERSVPIEVIPTCVDLERFQERPARPDGPHVVWSGSVGTWYRFDLAPRIAAALSLPLTVLTRQRELAQEMLGGYPATVRSAAPEHVSTELFAGDVGLCLIASSFSKIASAPTRFAEYLAAGMPVLVTPGVGDLESLTEEHQVGVVLRGDDDRSISDAAARVRALGSDPEVRQRCRQLARDRFDVAAGARHYDAIYRAMTTLP